MQTPDTNTVNLYYKLLYGRKNIIKEYIYYIFGAFSSFPRMLMEVFLRKEFGSRYFSTSGVIILAASLAGAPILLDDEFKYKIWDYYLTWYLFIAAFAYFAYLRWKEVRRDFSTFDFSRFSLFNGHIHPLLLKTFQHPKHDSPNVRQIETLIEPAIFFSAGLLLFLMHQPIGLVLMACSVFYSLFYLQSYHYGDDFIQDIIDTGICNEQTVNTFVHNKPPEETKGFQFRGKRPESMDNRWKAMDGFFEKNAPSSVVR